MKSSIILLLVISPFIFNSYNSQIAKDKNIKLKGDYVIKTNVSSVETGDPIKISFYFNFDNSKAILSIGTNNSFEAYCEGTYSISQDKSTIKLKYAGEGICTSNESESMFLIKKEKNQYYIKSKRFYNYGWQMLNKNTIHKVCKLKTANLEKENCDEKNEISNWQGEYYLELPSTHGDNKETIDKYRIIFKDLKNIEFSSNNHIYIISGEFFDENTIQGDISTSDKNKKSAITSISPFLSLTKDGDNFYVTCPLITQGPGFSSTPYEIKKVK